MGEKNMATTTATLPRAPAAAGRAVWAGRILSGFGILFLLMAGAMNGVARQGGVDTNSDPGWPVDPATLRMLGVLLLASTLLYAWPRTSLLGAILITAYLGGAIATHARIGSPLFSHTF